MRGLAELLLARGIAVSGSDLKQSRGLTELDRLGASVVVGHSAEQLEAAGRPEAVVISTAIPDANPELLAAREKSIPVWARAQVLAALMAGSRGLAVAGTHGKTTTTSMLSTILGRAGVDPTFVIGGDLNESGSGARSGGGEWFLAEADESDGSFLLLHPDVAVVTNVEADHLDFYRDEEEIRAAFARFLAQAGQAIVCGDDPGALKSLMLAGRQALSYGVTRGSDAVLTVKDPRGPRSSGSLDIAGERVEIQLRVPGEHNLLNAAGAVLAATLAGVAPADAAMALRSYRGVRRRFEFRGVARGAEFFDDYAHHPSEVAATLRAARNGYGRIVAVFQPHRYSRTRALWRELGTSLAEADVVIVTDVYDAGEDPLPGVTGKLVLDALAEAQPAKRILYLPHRTDVVRFLASEVRPGDLVLTLGAGDITTVPEEAIERLRSHPDRAR
jgi:UDP-N-acetylmuramate--alanine ligase